MKNINYSIRIPEPCHEDWNNMQPDAQGKFCSSCNKSVIDFSNKTDSEIKDILLHNKGKKVCGHFKSTQVNRPLNIRIHLNELPRNMSSARSFAVAIFLVFGTFLFSCKDVNGQVVGKVEIVKPLTTHFIKGKIAKPEPVREDTLPKMDTLVESPLGTFMSGGISFVELPADSEITRSTIPFLNEDPGREPLIMGEIMEVPEPKDSLLNFSESYLQEKTSLRLPEESFMEVQAEISIYPNPSAGVFIINYELLKRSDVSLFIFDGAGNLVKKVVAINKQYEGKYSIPVDLGKFPNGVYNVNLINDGKRFTQKLILER